MASARGDALDWALALARAPGERHALRQRPLPEGIDTVLQVAGGTHAVAIEAAAAHAGMAPAEVVEAARFYLREMLFFPGADAYRVLGLAADASDEQVKHHHRLLQQWLHPDRPTSDWDAAFAARVNAAWSQLRTAARREAYVATLPATPVATDAAPHWKPPPRIHAPSRAAAHADPALDQDRWRRRAPVLALFGVCAVLGALAVRDMQREPNPALAQVAMEQATIDTAPVALQLPEARPPGPAKPTPPQRSAVSRPAEKQIAAAPERAPPARTAIAAKAVVKPTPVVAAPKPVAQPIVAAGPPKPVSRPVAMAPTPQPVAKAVAVAVVTKPALVPTPAAATPAAATPMHAPAPVAVAPVKSSTVTVPPAPKPATRPAPVATALAPRVTTSVASKPAAVMPPPKPVAQPASPAAVVAATPPALAAATNAPEASSPQQVAQAQQTGQRLLAYVAGRGGGVPPIWANVASQTQASRAREALQGTGRVEVGTPNWRVGDTSAAMQASLTPRDGGARRLRVDMVWREQRWLVTGLVLEQVL